MASPLETRRGVPGPLRGGPSLLVRRPRIWRLLWAWALALLLVPFVLALLVRWFGRVPGPVLFILPLGVGFALWGTFIVLRLAWRGWSSYALTDAAFLFVGERGDTVGAISLGDITRLRLGSDGVLQIALGAAVTAGSEGRVLGGAGGHGIALGGPRQVGALELRALRRGSVRQWFIAPASGKTLLRQLEARVRAINPAVIIETEGAASDDARSG